MENLEPVKIGWKASPQEDLFIEKRIAEMSPMERLLLEAAMRMEPPATAKELINITYQVKTCYGMCYPAGNDYELGEYVMQYVETSKSCTHAFIDKEKLGHHHRSGLKPGLFINGAYVFQTGLTPSIVYDGSNLSEIKDINYSVKIKLSSESNKDGVWLCLPDYSEVNGGKPDELQVALDKLGVTSLQNCRAIEAVCVLPN